MRCAIWYHLYNFRKVKNAHGEVLLLATLLKVTLLHGRFSRFLNCTNGKKIAQCIIYYTLSDYNGTRTHNYFVCRPTLNDLAKLFDCLAKLASFVV